MRSSWPVLFMCVVYLSFWTLTAFARAPAGGLPVRIESLLQEGTALSQQRQTLTATLTRLLQQKQALEANARQLTQQQAQLNRQADAHNQRVAVQQKSLRKNQSECNNMGAATGTNTSGHVNQCDNEIKALNARTADIDAGVTGLAGQQAAVAKQTEENNQKINAWYPQEQQTVNQLNLIYQKTNDWMDRAYDFFASSRFQSAAHAAHADKDCSVSNQPSGTVTVQQLEAASVTALNCLRRVQKVGAGVR